jgi:hypothetical protein
MTIVELAALFGPERIASLTLDKDGCVLKCAFTSTPHEANSHMGQNATQARDAIVDSPPKQANGRPKVRVSLSEAADVNPPLFAMVE